MKTIKRAVIKAEFVAVVYFNPSVCNAKARKPAIEKKPEELICKGSKDFSVNCFSVKKIQQNSCYA